MIDIHTHILPGLDDGIATLPQALQLAFEYESEGINTVIATPHIKDGIYDVNREKILEGVELLNIELALAGINVDVYAGAEYYMDIRVLKDLDSGNLMALGKSRYVLLEFPSHHIPTYANTIIDILTEKEYIPVIAHPERCRDIMKKPAIIEKFMNRGCRIQLDSRSLTGENGKAILNLSFSFLNKDRVDFIGFDIHRVFPLKNHMDLLRNAVRTLGGCSVEQFLDRDEVFTGKGNLELRK